MTRIRQAILAAGITAGLVMSTGCASRYGEGWSRADTARQAVFIGLNAVDHAQTVQIARNPDKYYEQEAAWIIGKHPSEEEVHALMLGVAVGHTAVAGALKPSCRRIWQWIWIGCKARSVGNNYAIGLRGEW